METMYTAVKNYGDCDQCILLETADMSEAVACAKYEIGAGECNVEVVYFVDGEVREVSL